MGDGAYGSERGESPESVSQSAGKAMARPNEAAQGQGCGEEPLLQPPETARRPASEVLTHEQA